jgi:hypothetical protein
MWKANQCRALFSRPTWVFSPPRNDIVGGFFHSIATKHAGFDGIGMGTVFFFEFLMAQNETVLKLHGNLKLNRSISK